MMFLPLLAAAALQAAEAPPIVVRGPLPATPQVPATMVAEPVAMMIAACDGAANTDIDGAGDGVVERGELVACVKRSFAAADPARQGYLRYIAFADWAEHWLGNRAALPSPFEVDRNADDRITLDELQDQFSRLFARYDVDGDKRLMRAELLTYRTMPIGAPAPGAADKPADPAKTARPKRR